jgi:hypothetical protein
MQELRKEMRGRAFGYVSAALGLVAGLAWNDAIRSLIEAAFPLARDTVAIKFLYAALVTVVVVVLIKYLDRMLNKHDEAESKG